jgi:hypothetical protein
MFIDIDKIVVWVEGNLEEEQEKKQEEGRKIQDQCAQLPTYTLSHSIVSP